MSTFIRAFPLDDISIRSGGDGRTVEAYATVFDTEVPIRDHEGQYREVITRGAFRKTISERGNKFGVFYNHGRGINGEPSDVFSMPLGTPLEVREDTRGVLTVTRYNRNPLADQVLESIRNGDIRGQSFSGRFVKSDPPTPKWGYQPDERGDLLTVRRTEVAMREYGPTPFPAYEEATIAGIRAAFGALLDDEQLHRLLALTLDRADASPDHSAHAEPVAAEPDPTGESHSGRQWTPEQIARRQTILERT